LFYVAVFPPSNGVACEQGKRKSRKKFLFSGCGLEKVRHTRR